MLWYIELSTTFPYSIYMAMIQFAILGTLGDCIGKWMQSKRVYWPFGVMESIWKPIEWAILAVLIKYAFLGMYGFLDTLITNDYLPKIFSANFCWKTGVYSNGFPRAIAWSIIMNMQFGPLLVLLHRILDYAPLGKKIVWDNIGKGLFMLVWWWIPAHTITALLPQAFQVGMAAFWSIVLGFLLGLINPVKKV